MEFCVKEELLDRAELHRTPTLLHSFLLLFDDAIDCGAMEMEHISKLSNRYAISMEFTDFGMLCQGNSNSFHVKQKLNKPSFILIFFKEFSQKIV